MKLAFLLALAVVAFANPAAAQERPSAGAPERMRPEARIAQDDLGEALRAALRRGTARGVSLGDYLKCVQRCKELFPEAGDAQTECIKGCSKIESDLRVILP